MSLLVPPFKKRFGDSCPSRVAELQQRLEDDVDYSQANKGKPYCFKEYHLVSVILPSTSTSSEQFKQSYYMSVLDLDTKADLQRAKVINWCRTAKPLYPVRTKGDGNCMLHAVSLSVWGIEDDKQFLRRLLYATLVCDQTKNFQKRWLLQQRNIGLQRPQDFNPQLNSRDWNQEWENIIKAASDLPSEQLMAGTTYDTLEGIHLYVLANILRRPIILLADKTARSVFGNSMQENNMIGIYLPMEWDSKETSKSPIVIGYNLNHFTPLVAQQTEPNARAIDGKYVIPLVTHNFEPLPLQFLLPNEEMIAHELFSLYLKMENVPMTTSNSVQEVPVAKAEYQNIHDHFDVVRIHREECKQIYDIWNRRYSQPAGGNYGIPQVPSEPSPQNRPSFREAAGNSNIVNNEVMFVANSNPQRLESSSPLCVTPGCDMFGSPAYGNMCSTCFRKYTVQYNEVEQSRRQIQNINLAPSAPPPSLPVQESMYELSMMGEPCHTGCGNMCSVKTFPYCHECHDKMRAGSGQNAPVAMLNMQVQPPSAAQPAANEVRNERENDQKTPRDERLPTRPGLLQQGQNPLVLPSPILVNQICSTPNCEKRSVSEIGNKCAECFIKFGSGDFPTLSSHEPHNEEPSSQTYIMNLSTKTPVMSEGTPSPGDSRNLPRFPSANVPRYPGPQAGQNLREQQMVTCRSRDCKEYRYEHLDNLCLKCYEREHGPQEVQGLGSSQKKRLCSTPGCQGIRLQNQHNYCLACFTRSNCPAEGVLPPPDNSTLESKTPMPTNELPKEKVVTSSKEKVKCASPLCSSLIYPPKQLCDSCVGILQRNYAATVPGSSRSRSMEMHRESPTKQGLAYSPTRHKCKTKGCDFYGDKRFHGHCSSCDKAKKFNNNTSPMLRVQPQLSNMMPPSSAANLQAQKCVEPGCDKYGDPNMYFRCSDHYRYAVNTPIPPVQNFPLLPAQIEQYNIAENDPPPFRLNYVPNIPVTSSSQQHWTAGASSQARTKNTVTSSSENRGGIEGLRKVENSRRGIRCKKAGCDNYGNSQKEGFCNSCYQNVQTKRAQTSHDEFGGGNYHCC